MKFSTSVVAYALSWMALSGFIWKAFEKAQQVSSPETKAWLTAWLRREPGQPTSKSLAVVLRLSIEAMWGASWFRRLLKTFFWASLVAALFAAWHIRRTDGRPPEWAVWIIANAIAVLLDATYLWRVRQEISDIAADPSWFRRYAFQLAVTATAVSGLAIWFWSEYGDKPSRPSDPLMVARVVALPGISVALIVALIAVHAVFVFRKTTTPYYRWLDVEQAPFLSLGATWIAVLTLGYLLGAPVFLFV